MNEIRQRRMISSIELASTEIIPFVVLKSSSHEKTKKIIYKRCLFSNENCAASQTFGRRQNTLVKYWFLKNLQYTFL